MPDKAKQTYYSSKGPLNLASRMRRKIRIKGSPRLLLALSSVFHRDLFRDQKGDVVVSEKEVNYLKSQRLARIAYCSFCFKYLPAVLTAALRL